MNKLPWIIILFVVVCLWLASAISFAAGDIGTAAVCFGLGIAVLVMALLLVD